LGSCRQLALVHFQNQNGRFISKVLKLEPFFIRLQHYTNFIHEKKTKNNKINYIKNLGRIKGAQIIQQKRKSFCYNKKISAKYFLK
jgi:hypothetical protein